MTASLAPNFTRLAMTRPLALRLLTEDGAPPLASVPVQPADLADPISETWRDLCLRAGHPGVALADLAICLSPILAQGSDSRCTGYRLEVQLPSGEPTHRDYSFRSLRHVAQRASRALVAAGVLKTGESYLYELVVDAQGEEGGTPTAEGIPLNLSVRSAALTYLRLSLRSLLERATPVGTVDETDFPVFFSEDAFARAEACARRGAQAEPAVETGGALFGSLAACADSGEFCAIVTDVLEIQDAEEQTFSLAFTSRSWLQLQTIQKARQAAFPERADRLLGQCHGHPFRPNDGKVCAECDQRATCTLTSVFVSADDQAWHRSVFVRQPWALCHIFGLTARGEPLHQLFGLKDGRLQPRGFYLLPDFDFA